jgi:hypothetical protein
MNCKRAQELISLHLDEQLDPAGQGKLNGHLEACDPCSSYLEDLREGLDALRGLELEEPSANFDWNLRRKLQQAQHEPWRYQEQDTGHGFWPRFTLAAAAALLLTLGGAYGTYRMMQAPVSPQLGPRNTTRTAGSLDIPALPQPYPGAAAEGERDLQVVGQGDFRGPGNQQRGAIERSDPANSLPPLELRDGIADRADSLVSEGEDTEEGQP